MERELFKKTNFSLAENVSKLGQREKAAVETILYILRNTFIVNNAGEKNKLIGITIPITPDKPFRKDDFSKVMFELGIESLITSGTDDKITYQPHPVGNNILLKNIMESQECANQFINNFLKFEPSPINRKPQK